MSDTARIITSQNVIINYETANIGERLIARLLDLIFFVAYLGVFYFLLENFIGFSGDNDPKFGSVIAILIPVPVMTYTLWAESLFNGRSLGKLIMGLKVVKTDGSPAGVGEFAYRWISRIFEGEILSIFTCLALPVAMVSDKSQRIGDMIAGTIVIKTKQRSSLRNTILSQIHPQYQVVFPQVANLSDRDMNTIRDVMTQAFDTGNHRLLEYLGAKIKSVMGVNPNPQQLPTVQFLNIVLADYTHYNFHGA
ncbi:MAG TPA: RDD family protein [Bacteroidia bacterium]|nr:RDD family protein [Bacteroidia bacterium]